MKRWNLEIRVGLIIAIAIAFFIFLILNAADWQWGGGKRKLKISFRFVSDIQEGAPVYLSGVAVGKVRHIRLTSEGALIEASITDDDQPLRVGCKANITMLGLVGESVLSLDNGPPENPLLPPDTIIEGTDPANVMETFNQAGKAVEISVQTLQMLQDTIQRQDEQITSLVDRIERFLESTQAILEQTSQETHELFTILLPAINRNDTQLTGLLVDLRDWLRQTQENSDRLMAQIEVTSRQVSELVLSNEEKVQQTLDDFAAAARSLHELAVQVGDHSQDLGQQIDKLLSDTDAWIQEERPQIHLLLEGLQSTNEQLQPLLTSLGRISQELEEGNGTLPQLLNDDTTLDALGQILQKTEDALTELSELTRTARQKTQEIPDIGWDYELRYRADARQLHNEANLYLKTPTAWDYRLGLTSRGEDLDFNVQIGYRLPALTVRAGLLRSQAALGLDYEVISERLRFTLEGIGITTSEPLLTFESGVQFFPNWEILVGGETPIRKSWRKDDLGFHLGVRLNY